MFLVPAEKELTPEMIHWLLYSKDHPLCRQVLDCHLAILKNQTLNNRARYTRAIDEYIIFWNSDEQKCIRAEQRERGKTTDLRGYTFA